MQSVAIVVLAVLVALLVLAVWSMKRHRDPHLQIDCDEPLAELMPSLAGLSLGTVTEGNSIELFENAAFYDVLASEIAGARHTIHFETYLWKEGVLGQRLADALCERARAGLKVRVLADAAGTKKMGTAVERALKDAGCRLVKFHPRTPYNIGIVNERDHRKLAVIDGRVAFVGGHCIADDWLGAPPTHFGDISVRLRGPIVHTVQSAFSENWAGESGELFVGEHVFPKLEKAGDVSISAAFVKPEGSAPAVKLLHHTVICLARKRIWIQNPYFIPEPEAIDAFGAAVKRGVDVRVLMPSTGGSDNPIVQHAGHRNFEKLLRNGVRLFEYPHTLLHQKVMTVDGIWCAIGSSNFDDRSFEINDEISLSVCDPGTVGKLDAIFEKYAVDAKEIELERWRRRGLLHRLKDNLYYLFNEVL